MPKSEAIRSETLRFDTLERYRILDTAPTPALDDLAELVARICSTQAAALSFAAANRIVLRGRYGISESELP
ncbi:MAG TPA: hypothetical protein VGU23_03160, partial [Acidobacteriaceae bacterium]|nr:hypothetical protein [Acidobacteriaceae bacterium]